MEDEQHYFWSGPTVLQAGSLLAGAETAFKVTPCFTFPGIYSLEHFQLVVTAPGIYPRPFIVTPPQHLISISSAAAPLLAS